VRWLPIGSWEPHGGHLPYDCDTLIASHLASECHAPEDIVLPAIPYGCSYEHRGLGNPVSLSVTTFATMVSDIVHAHQEPIVILNAHGGNQILESLVQELNATGSSVLLLPTRAHWDQAYQATGWPFRIHDDMHAGAMDRSLLLVWEPNRVSPSVPDDVTAPDRPLFSAVGMRGYTQGLIGFPSYATVEAGRIARQSLVKSIQTTVKDWVNG